MEEVPKLVASSCCDQREELVSFENEAVSDELVHHMSASVRGEEEGDESKASLVNASILRRRILLTSDGESSRKSRTLYVLSSAPPNRRRCSAS